MLALEQLEQMLTALSIPPLACRSLIDDEIKSDYSAVNDGNVADLRPHNY